MSTKILFDTDIGDDIDDAFALALVCASKELDLVAVTTVFKNTLARAKQARQLLDTVGRGDVPVYVGEGMPLCGVIPSFDVQEGDLLNVLPCQYDESMDGCEVSLDAVEAIGRYARKYSGELTVVNIGAATNLAKALQRDETLAKHIKRVVMMGGWFTNFAPEWNVLCDPVAMDVLFKSGVEIQAVGLDVTLQCVLNKSLLERFTSSNLAVNKLLTKWLNKWFAFFHFEKSVMHDPLAIAAIIDGEVCRFETKYVKVVLDGDKRGAVEVSDVAKLGFSPIQVATSVDTERFYGIVENALLQKA